MKKSQWSFNEWLKVLSAPVPWSRAAIGRFRVAGLVVLVMLLASYWFLWIAVNGRISLWLAGFGEVVALLVILVTFYWALNKRRQEVMARRDRRGD